MAGTTSALAQFPHTQGNGIGAGIFVGRIDDRGIRCDRELLWVGARLQLANDTSCGDIDHGNGVAAPSDAHESVFAHGHEDEFAVTRRLNSARARRHGDRGLDATGAGADDRY